MWRRTVSKDKIGPGAEEKPEAAPAKPPKAEKPPAAERKGSKEHEGTPEQKPGKGAPAEKQAKEKKTGKDQKPEKGKAGAEPKPAEKKQKPPRDPPGYMPRLKKLFRETVSKDLREEFAYKTPLQVPRVAKIVVSMGVGEATVNKKLLDSATGELTQITGRKAVRTKAKKSIAQFKVRKGMDIGAVVTLRGNTMYEFLDRLVNVAMPRIKDFRGANPNAFDGHGNYSLGVTEQIIFPEIDYDKIERVCGLNIAVVTTARTDAEARSLLGRLGMPFRK
jgi:large subunit ribosomal protein L5